MDEIINDLLEINPCEVLTAPLPYDERQTLDEKVEITYRHTKQAQTNRSNIERNLQNTITQPQEELTGRQLSRLNVVHRMNKLSREEML
ncbi:21657_t:CDS:2 [Cetraspora pellucida]|uniref:21657_t:CDS:1 n=1 Tax=Cetraspora pellucida TaxID=1433469 RepID=A0A9N9H2N4_9GLOM|nr:21657_t:CDS:2 [Cetraspora pellucida]